ncbi:class II aldolase/adducin family protein [Micropruina sonneratiae]|uniref:class II aldolase/adducin family protein n=1 Tax=Micropruina sonneratiae TaxID=2986940 RepID=UPI0022274D19|nr:class II aldolase/adducin family protein [Micropruina sp. KQZ13P-5]MCW3159558.1 class II aldolase/adducin family protein [Micropruina sp. KQZ13P-5]
MLLGNEREQIVEACRFMQRENLVVGTAGNVSVRVGEHVAISPSGVPYEVMSAADVVVTDLSGATVDGSLTPSSELPLHLAVYAATPAAAITHNHAPASTALGLVVDEIPPSHYYSAMFGGVVRVAPYAPFGTDELARNVAAALADRTGALMGNHGAITIGPSLDKALSLLPYLEYICEIQLRAMATNLPVKLVPPDLLDVAVAGMATYGQQPTH